MFAGDVELIQLARKLASSIDAGFSGCWCFFAGFGFMLNGVEKKTGDIDVLTKDVETYQYMRTLVQRIGMQLLTATKNYSSFKAKSEVKGHLKVLTLDLLLIGGEWLKSLKNMWAQLEGKSVGDSILPVPNPVHLILLKIIVNAHRSAWDKKKQRDFLDVEQLMRLRGITDEQIMKEAISQGIEGMTLRFLTKLKELCSEK